MRVLIAPDKFKDTLTARDAAEAIRLGVLDVVPAAEIDICPMADGGEGSGELLADALDASARTASVLDPLGRAISARWWITNDAAIAIVEMAEATGLQLLGEAERDPIRSTSYGTGQLLACAIDAGAKEILLCVGGSATVDGGAAAIQALGGTLFGADRVAITRPVAGGELRGIASIDLASIGRSNILVLSDVDNPCCGPTGAAVVYGPQKGAAPESVHILDDGLRHWMRVLHAASGIDASELPGGGAAGGIVAGLIAAIGARRVSGFDEIARRVRLAERIASSDVVFTGEGCLDSQSARGKVVGGVAGLARRAGRSTIAIAGRSDGPAGELARSIGLAEVEIATPTDVAWDDVRRNAADYVRRAARRLADRANLG